MFQSWTLIAQVWSQGKCINILAWPKQCGKYAGWEVITSISWHLSHNDRSNYNWAQKPSQEDTTGFLAWVKGTSQWLKRNNSLYQDITISDEHLWLLPVDAISHQVCHILEIWLSPTPIISGHFRCHLQSCIVTSLYARKMIIFYFTNIDNLYISLYFTILVLWTLQLWVQQTSCSP